MAIVRLSQQLKIQISNIAMNVYAKRIEDAHKAFVFPYDGPTLYDMILGEWSDRMLALPMAFFTMRTSIAIRRIGDIAPSSDDSMLPLAKAMPFPRAFPTGHDVMLTDLDRRDYALITLLPSPRWDPLIAMAQAWKDNYDAVYKQGSDFSLSVMKVLDAHSSLNAAVKTWPALWELIPDEYKNRMREASPREKKSANVAADVDINQLTGIIAASKIL